MSDVSLKEHLETRFDELEKRIELSARANEAALAVQTNELARRLDTLNHAHQQAVEKESSFLPRGEYGIAQAEWHRWRNDIEAWRNRVIGIAIGGGAAGGIIAALLTRMLLK